METLTAHSQSVSLQEIQYNHEAGSCSLSVTAALCQKAVDIKPFFLAIKTPLGPLLAENNLFLGLKEKHPHKDISVSSSESRSLAFHNISSMCKN